MYTTHTAVYHLISSVLLGMAQCWIGPENINTSPASAVTYIIIPSVIVSINIITTCMALLKKSSLLSGWRGLIWLPGTTAVDPFSGVKSVMRVTEVRLSMWEAGRFIQSGSEGQKCLVEMRY